MVDEVVYLARSVFAGAHLKDMCRTAHRHRPACKRSARDPEFHRAGRQNGLAGLKNRGISAKAELSTRRVTGPNRRNRAFRVGIGKLA